MRSFVTHPKGPPGSRRRRSTWPEVHQRLEIQKEVGTKISKHFVIRTRSFGGRCAAMRRRDEFRNTRCDCEFLMCFSTRTRTTTPPSFRKTPIDARERRRPAARARARPSTYVPLCYVCVALSTNHQHTKTRPAAAVVLSGKHTRACMRTPCAQLRRTHDHSPPPIASHRTPGDQGRAQEVVACCNQKRAAACVAASTRIYGNTAARGPASPHCLPPTTSRQLQ